jgi:hypothetical protein
MKSVHWVGYRLDDNVIRILAGPRDLSLTEMSSPRDLSLTEMSSPRDLSMTKMSSPSLRTSLLFNGYWGGGGREVK